MKNNNTVNVSFPFFSILTLIFITLKLTGYITWSWWWVLIFVWVPLAILAFLVFIVGVLYVLNEYRK